MRIWLVRHGESEANVDRAAYDTTSDYEIALTEKGRLQASMAGEYLRKWYAQPAVQQELAARQEAYDQEISRIARVKNTLAQLAQWLERLSQEHPQDDMPALDASTLEEAFHMPAPNRPRPPETPLRVYASPYKRARQTAEEIVNKLDGVVERVRQSNFLAEKDFGIATGHGYASEEAKEILEGVYELYKRQAATPGGKHFARKPFGESDFDVAQRVKALIGKIMRDASKTGIEDFLIVSHGMTMRAFAQQFLDEEVEWIENTPNPGNGEIWCITGSREEGYRLETHFTGKRSEIEALQSSSSQEANLSR